MDKQLQLALLSGDNQKKDINELEISEDEAVDKAINALFQKYDKEGKGTLGLPEAKEFVSFVMIQMGMLEKGKTIDNKNLETIFKQIDTDNSGTIDCDEFKVLFQGLKDKFSKVLERSP